MTTWKTFLEAVRRTSQDNVPDASGEYNVPDEQVLKYFRYAQMFASSRHPSQKRQVVAVDSGTSICVLPAGLYRIMGIHSDSGPLSESYGFKLKSDSYSVLSDTELKIGDPKSTSITIIYSGEYDEIVGDDTDILPGPEWLEEPLFLFVVARMIAHVSVSAGDISQWRTKVDSGNPEDNPLLRLADYYDGLAEKALGRRQQR